MTRKEERISDDDSEGNTLYGPEAERLSRIIHYVLED